METTELWKMVYDPFMLSDTSGRFSLNMLRTLQLLHFTAFNGAKSYRTNVAFFSPLQTNCGTFQLIFDFSIRIRLMVGHWVKAQLHEATVTV